MRLPLSRHYVLNYLPRVAVRLFGEDDESALTLGGYLLEAYQEAEKFSQLLLQRIKGAGFFKTLLLRRLGSSMEAGRRTVIKLLGQQFEEISDEEDDFDEEAEREEALAIGRMNHPESEFKNFTTAEVQSLNRCLQLLKQGGNRDPKLEAIAGYLLGMRTDIERRWLDLGCILFSQYYDTVRWVGDELAKRSEFQGLEIGLYAGSNRLLCNRPPNSTRCVGVAAIETNDSGSAQLGCGVFVTEDFLPKLRVAS